MYGGATPALPRALILQVRGSSASSPRSRDWLERVSYSHILHQAPPIWNPSGGVAANNARRGTTYMRIRRHALIW
jgi:hypothetical protein